MRQWQLLEFVLLLQHDGAQDSRIAPTPVIRHLSGRLDRDLVHSGSGGWNCSSRSAVIGEIRNCRFGSWLSGTGCIDAPCGRLWLRRCHHRANRIAAGVRPAIDDWAELIDSWLIADQQAPRKQRHTARRMWQRLVAEHGATMSESTVTRYARHRRSESGLVEIEVTVPQTHLPAAEAEVDFG